MPDHLEFHEKNVARPFVYSNEVKSIHFAKEVESIDAAAFYDFRNLETVTFDPECKITTIEKDTFKFCEHLNTIVFPNNITSIEDGAFMGCYALKTVDMPESIETFGTFVFSNCTNLAEFKFPPKLKIIPFGIFNDCKYLKTVNIPDMVEIIESEAFCGCSRLESVKIPNSVKTIGAAFKNCYSLKTLTIGKNVSLIEKMAFYSSNNLTELNLPKAKINKCDFSNPDQITQKQLNEFKEYLDLPKYCNIKVAGQILEPDSNAKIQQCKTILLNDKYISQLRTIVVRSHLAVSYSKIGKTTQASKQVKILKELETTNLYKHPEFKKQCEQNCKIVNMNQIKDIKASLQTKMKAIRQAQKTLKSSKIKNIDTKDREM